MTEKDTWLIRSLVQKYGWENMVGTLSVLSAEQSKYTVNDPKRQTALGLLTTEFIILDNLTKEGEGFKYTDYIEDIPEEFRSLFTEKSNGKD